MVGGWGGGGWVRGGEGIGIGGEDVVVVDLDGEFEGVGEVLVWRYALLVSLGLVLLIVV